MTTYNPIQYNTVDAYSSTEILVRLDRTSLKGARSKYSDLPTDFVEFIDRLDQIGTICPLFLDGVDVIPPAEASTPFRQLREGIREYLPASLTLWRRDGTKLVQSPLPLTAAQTVNVLTNFCIRYTNPADALGALDELRAMTSVAVAEPSPARYIVVLEPRGAEGPPKSGPRRGRRETETLGSATGVGVALGTGLGVGIGVGAGGLRPPAAELLGTESLAAPSASSVLRQIYSEMKALHGQIGDLNQNIAAMRKTLAENKCCKEDKKSDVPDVRFQQWPLIALQAPPDCNRGEGITLAMFDLGVDFTLRDFDGHVPDTSGVMRPRVEVGVANEKPFYLENFNQAQWDSVQASAAATEAGQSYGDALNPNKVLGHHGTAVAGIMIGEYTGFLPRAKVVSYQVSAGRTFQYNTDDGKVVRYFPVDSVLYATALFNLSAHNSDVEVLNVSLGGSAPLCEFEKIGYRALASVNIRVVAGAGNHFRKGEDPRVLYPARHLGVLSVGAVGIEGSTQYYKRAEFSNFDLDDCHVNLMAPGVGVYSCLPRSYGKKDDCGWFNGTSFAAPWVSAMYAWAVHENIPFELPEVSQKLFYQSAEEPFDGENGYGLVKFDKVVDGGKRQNSVLCYVPKSYVQAAAAGGGYGKTTTTSTPGGYAQKAPSTVGGPFTGSAPVDPNPPKE